MSGPQVGTGAARADRPAAAAGLDAAPPLALAAKLDRAALPSAVRLLA